LNERAHFADFSLIYARRPSPELPIGVAPAATSRSRTSGVLKISAVRSWILLMMSGGVPTGDWD